MNETVKKKYLEIQCCDECPYFLTDNYGRKYCFETGSKFVNIKPFVPTKFKRNCPLSDVKANKM